MVSENTTLSNYKKYRLYKLSFGIALLVILIILSFISINIGPVDIEFKEMVKACLGMSVSSSAMVTMNIRFPRLLAAILTGACLASAGCVMQNILNNPLASPSTLGISNAAAFGANVAIVILGASVFKSCVTLCAFISSMMAVTVILLLTKFKNFSAEAIVLSGVALSSLFSAGTIIIQYFAEDTELTSVIFWTFGDLGRISWKELLILFILTLLSLIYFCFRRWEYNSLESGNEFAKSLGVNVERIRIFSIIISSLITAASVSFVGIIGFIGLISPQITKRVIGGDYIFLIPVSALMGSVILLSADTLARSILSPIVLPVGALTSFLGAPIFFYFLIRRNTKA